jgi:superfamily II DNA or RNA helicase
MLVLVHREELADQAIKQFRLWNQDAPLEVGIEMGEQECSGWEKIVIAGVNTLGRANSRRLLKFSPSAFDVIVCDEAHHSAAPSYLKVFDHFGLRDSGNKKLLLGVTATPFRADDKQLVPGVYQDIIYMMQPLEAIEEGWLCDLRSFRVEKTGTDLDLVVTRADDFAEDQLENAVDNRIRNGLIAKEWKRLAGNRRTIVFAVTVKHAQNLAAAFRDYGVTAKAVWGEDPEREVKINAHKEGTLQVLCNCAVLTEGYDDWRIECIVMARPTLSRVLFVQMIGRGARIEEGLTNLVEARRNGLPISKTECIVMDVVDNTKKHDLITLPRLFNSKLDFHGKSLTEIHKQAKPGEISNPYLNSTELQQVERVKVRIKEVDLFRGTRRQYLLGVNRPGAVEVPVLPSGSGSVRYWEDSPGEWRVAGTIDGGALEVGATFTESQARTKAQELASRRIGPTRLEFPVKWKPKRSKPSKPRRQMAPCPYCKQRMRVGGLQNHMKARCPKRLAGVHPAGLASPSSKQSNLSKVAPTPAPELHPNVSGDQTLPGHKNEPILEK